MACAGCKGTQCESYDYGWDISVSGVKDDCEVTLQGPQRTARYLCHPYIVSGNTSGFPPPQGTAAPAGGACQADGSLSMGCDLVEGPSSAICLRSTVCIDFSGGSDLVGYLGGQSFHLTIMCGGKIITDWPNATGSCVNGA